MNEKIYTITLDDGTVIEPLRLNGNNFISQREITPEIFEGNLVNVTISDGEMKEIHKNMDLVQITKTENEYWFILRDLTTSEIEKAKLRSDLDYVMMMTDIEI